MHHTNGIGGIKWSSEGFIPNVRGDIDLKYFSLDLWGFVKIKFIHIM